MNKSRILSVLCAVASLGAVANVSAAEEEVQGFVLDPMVITATTTPNSLLKTNAAVTVITAKEIEENHYTTLHEALEHVSGVDTVLWGSGAGYEISSENGLAMRGSQQCIFAIDGIPQKYYNHLTVMNMDDVERIEVLKGSASTLYGPDAVGGVVNVITKSHYEKPEGKIRLSAGNFGHKNGHVSYSGEEGKMFWAVAYDKTRKGNYKSGHGDTTQRSTDNDNIDLKVGAHLSDTTDVVLKYHDMRYDGYTWHLQPPGYARRGMTMDYRYQTFAGMVNYKALDGKEANTFAVEVNKSYTNRYRSGWNVREGETPVLNAFGNSHARNTIVSDRYYKQLSNRNRIAAGFQYQHYGTSGSTQRIDEKSFYIQDEWDVLPNLKLTAGTRFAGSSRYKDRWTYDINASYTIGNAVNLYLQTSEFYKTPSTTAMFGSSTFLANPSIKPETGRNREIGIKADINKKTQLNIALFDRVHENAIARTYDAAAGKSIYYNIDGKTHVKGAEVDLISWFGKYWEGRVAYSHLRVDNDAIISSFPKNQYSISLKYEKDKFNATLQGLNRFDFAKGAYYPANYKGPDGKGRYLPQLNYWVWNLSANYKINNKWKVFGKIYNIFDANYSSGNDIFDFGDYSDSATAPFMYVYAPGRSFMIGAEYSF